MVESTNRYIQIIEEIFQTNYKIGSSEVPFSRDQIIDIANTLNIPLPKNLGDIIYSFRYRNSLPQPITKLAPKDFEWIIRSAGRGKYKFVLSKKINLTPNPNLQRIKIPDTTPGLINIYSFDDEQSLLAKIRYNRLVDIFTGVTCYSLQNHLRTTVSDIGQIETDEVYLGIDKNGIHYVFPVQAKSKSDKIGVIQIEQDFLLCNEKFSGAIGRPIAAQYVGENTIALLEFTQDSEGIKIVLEKQFTLVHPDDLSPQEIIYYQKHLT